MWMTNEYCPMTCNYLNITEWDQNQLKNSTGETIRHMCLKYDQPLYHMLAHPNLYKCEECYKETKND